MRKRTKATLIRDVVRISFPDGQNSVRNADVVRVMIEWPEGYDLEQEPVGIIFGN